MLFHVFQMTSSTLSRLNKAPLLKKAQSMETRIDRLEKIVQVLMIVTSASVFSAIIANQNLSVF